MDDITYDAFISYRSTASGYARRVRDALTDLGKGAHSDRPFSVFLDTSSLLAGDLGPAIEDALKASHCLVVLLALDTIESEWVSQEIRYWLANGGSASRLFLVRIDGIDLSWQSDPTGATVAELGDEVPGTWRTPEALPQPLRGLFVKQQKWIDLHDSPRSADRFKVSPIFARARDKRLEELQLDEIQRERKRRRQLGLVTASMALLLVLSLVASSLAIASRNAAEAAAREARAEANAAQAVLVGSDSPVRSAQNALEAAQENDSASVRAAMLAAISGASHLRHSINPHSVTATDISISPDEKILSVIGGPPDAPLLDIYDLQEGRFIDHIVLPEGTDQVHMVTSTLGITCSDRSGSLIVRHGPGGLSLEPLVERTPDPGSQIPLDGETQTGCTLVEAPQGLLVSTHGTGNDHEAYQLHLVESAGIHKIASEKSLRPSEFYTEIAGNHKRLLIQDIVSDSVWVLDLPSRTLSRNSDLPPPFHEDFRVIDTDKSGDFLIEASSGEGAAWAFLRWDGTAYVLEELGDQNQTAMSTAAVLDEGKFIGAITIDDSGMVRNTVSNTELQLGPDLGIATSNTYRRYHPSITRLTERRYLAVFATSAVMIDIAPSFIETGWRTIPTDWAIKPIDVPLREPGLDGSYTHTQVCEYSTLLNVSIEQGSILMTSEGQFRHLPDGGVFTPSCNLIESHPSLAIRSPWGDDIVFKEVSKASLWEASESLVVTLNGSDPIEVYSLDQVNQFWTFTQNDRGMMSRLRGHDATGIGRVFEYVTFISRGAPVASVEIDSDADIVAIAPDGGAFLMDTPRAGGRDIVLVNERDERTELPHCASEPYSEEFFVFAPPDNFTSEQAIPVKWERLYDENSYINCLTGATWQGVEPWSLSDYLLFEGGAGVITTHEHDPESTLITYSRHGWTQGGAAETRSVEVPDPAIMSPWGPVIPAYSWSPDGTWFAVSSDSGARVYRWTGGTMEEMSAITPGIGALSLIQFLTDDGLLFVLEHSEQFEIIDAATGFRLGAGELDVTPSSAFVSEANGVVSIGLPEVWSKATTGQPVKREDELLALDYMTVPVGLDEIREVLCGIHRTELCEPPS